MYASVLTLLHSCKGILLSTLTLLLSLNLIDIVYIVKESVHTNFEYIPSILKLSHLSLHSPVNNSAAITCKIAISKESSGNSLALPFMSIANANADDNDNRAVVFNVQFYDGDSLIASATDVVVELYLTIIYCGYYYS